MAVSWRSDAKLVAWAALTFGALLASFSAFRPVRDALILETLLAFKRAGATGVLTYHAVDAARLITA